MLVFIANPSEVAHVSRFDRDVFKLVFGIGPAGAHVKNPPGALPKPGASNTSLGLGLAVSDVRVQALFGRVPMTDPSSTCVYGDVGDRHICVGFAIAERGIASLGNTCSSTNYCGMA